MEFKKSKVSPTVTKFENFLSEEISEVNERDMSDIQKLVIQYFFGSDSAEIAKKAKSLFKPTAERPNLSAAALKYLELWFDASISTRTKAVGEKITDLYASYTAFCTKNKVPEIALIRRKNFSKAVFFLALEVKDLRVKVVGKRDKLLYGVERKNLVKEKLEKIEI